MPKDLFCPLKDNCEIYKKCSPSALYNKIIKGSTEGYSCRALYMINSDEEKAKKDILKSDFKESECALIELLNNSIKPNIIYRDLGGGIV